MVAVRRALASVSWKRVRPLFVAAFTILLRWPSRAWRAKSSVGVVAVADSACNASVSGVSRAPGVAVSEVMPWIVIVVAALPKTTPRSPVARCYHSIMSWCAWKVFFHAAHVLLERGRLSQSRRCFGKLSAARKNPVTIAASHMLLMGRFV